MKSRHAAALALLGWYLMVPPEFCLGLILTTPRALSLTTKRRFPNSVL
jgi:hypothetical protein